MRAIRRSSSIGVRVTLSIGDGICVNGEIFCTHLGRSRAGPKNGPESKLTIKLPQAMVPL